MSANNNDVLVLHANPTNIQYKILKDMQDTVAGGKTINTPNNVCSFMIEAFSNTSSGLVQDFLSELETVFSKRVVDSKNLFKHLSDFEYVGLFSSPASTDLEFVINLHSLISPSTTEDNVNTNIIPRDSEVIIGKYVFTLHYPIVIKTNTLTDSVSVSYDTTYNNPMYMLANNTLENRVYSDSGVKVLSIKIPFHQFTRTTVIEDLFPTSPFSKQYKLTSKFYAVRAYVNREFTKVPNFKDAGVTWTEIHQTLSSEIYDIGTGAIPTIIVNVDTDKQTLTVTVPFIYITNNMVGTQLRIEIMETEGDVDIDASSLENTLLPARFPLTSSATDKYTTALTNTNNLNVVLINSRIIGGSDGISFENLRNRVVYNTFNDKLLVTPMDLIGFFNDSNIGFNVTKFKDGITSRIYLCHKELRDTTSAIIPSGDIPTIFNTTDIVDNRISTITKFNDGTYIAKPSAMYKYDSIKNACIPMTDDEIDTLENQLSIDEKINTLNSGVYTFNPFYTKISTINNIPIASTYDLESPYIDIVEFKDASADGGKVSIYHSYIEFDTVSNEYVLNIEVGRSSDMTPNDIRIAAYTTDINNRKVYQLSDEFVESEDTLNETKVGDTNVHKYTIRFKTTHHLFGNNAIDIDTSTYGTGISNIVLNPTISVICYVNNDPVKNLLADLPISSPVQIDNYSAVTKTNLSIVLGKQIQELFNPVDITFDSSLIATYTAPEYVEYVADAYAQQGENGTYILTAVDDSYLLTKIHCIDRNQYSNFLDNIVLTNGNKATYIDNYRVVQVDGLVALDSTLASSLVLSGVAVSLIPNVITLVAVPEFAALFSLYDDVGSGELSLTHANIASIKAELVAMSVSLTSNQLAVVTAVTTELIAAHASDKLASDYYGQFVVNMTDYPEYAPGTDVLVEDYIVGKTFPLTDITIGVPVKLHSVGDPIIPITNGAPTIASRAINYRVNMIQINKRMRYGDLNAYGNYTEKEYIDSIRNVIMDHCDIVKKSKDRLLPNTEIYFRPSRAIGTSKFKYSSASADLFNLEVGLSFKLFVSRIVMSNQTVKDEIRKTIISIIDDATTKSIFSLTDISDTIMSKLGHLIKSVDVTGISNDKNYDDLQTLIAVDEGTILNLKHILVNNNGIIDIDRDVTIDFIVANNTTTLI